MLHSTRFFDELWGQGAMHGIKNKKAVQATEFLSGILE